MHGPLPEKMFDTSKYGWNEDFGQQLRSTVHKESAQIFCTGQKKESILSK